jgi:hypothetical protein
MKDQKLLHSLTWSSYAIPWTVDLSTVSHVECKTGCYPIHLLDHRVCAYKLRPVNDDTRLMEDLNVVHSGTSRSFCCRLEITCRPYHRLNGGAESSLFTYVALWLCVMEEMPGWNMTCLEVCWDWCVFKYILFTWSFENIVFIKKPHVLWRIWQRLIRLSTDSIFELIAISLKVYCG